MNGNLTLSIVDAPSNMHDTIGNWTVFLKTLSPWQRRARPPDS